MYDYVLALVLDLCRPITERVSLFGLEKVVVNRGRVGISSTGLGGVATTSDILEAATPSLIRAWISSSCKWS